MIHKCDYCNEIFTRKQNLRRHENKYHFKKPIKEYHTNTNIVHHNCSYNLPQLSKNEITRYICKSAFGNCIRHIRFMAPIKNDWMPEDFFSRAQDLIIETIDTLRDENEPLKILSTLCIRFYHIDKPNLKEIAYFSAHSRNIEDFNIDNIFNSIYEKIGNYLHRGSNWLIGGTLFFEINVTKFNQTS